MCVATINRSFGKNLNRNIGSKEKDDSLPPASGLQRMFLLILTGWCFNTLVYFTVYAFLLHTGWNLTPAQEFCRATHDDSAPCTRRDLFAFQVVSFLNLSYLGLLGFVTFFVTKRATLIVPRTPQGRILGNVIVSNVSTACNAVTTGKAVGVLLPEADYVNAGIVIFQGWDFVASIFFEEHRTLVMMSHHFLAFLCGWFSLEYGVSLDKTFSLQYC